MYTDVKKLIVDCRETIRRALEKMNEEGKGILLAVDYKGVLVGTITDGDLRRAILKGVGLADPIETFIHPNPIVARPEMDEDTLKDMFIKKAVKQIPLVDQDGILLDLISLNDILIEKGRENIVIIMAGGLGTRLEDLTKEIPKPMLKVGEHPILQHIISGFKRNGYNRFLISVNYKAEIIENYFQDGNAHGVNIKYIKEEKRLGTGGGIDLAREYIEKPFFVINGDIFTSLNYHKMMTYHLEHGNHITIGTRKHVVKIPYGVIQTDEDKITGLVEKPETEYMINAGVYCLNPEVIKYVPSDQYFEITDLISLCIKSGEKVQSYEIEDYWMDIGHLNDYYKVNEEYKNIRDIG